MQPVLLQHTRQCRVNYRGFVNTTKQAICYLQKEGMYLSDEKGHIYHDRFGTPAKINLWIIRR